MDTLTGDAAGTLSLKNPRRHPGPPSSPTEVTDLVDLRHARRQSGKTGIVRNVTDLSEGQSWLAGGHAVPPPGRTQLAWGDAEAALVHDPCFSSSANRPRLWENLSLYIANFLDLQDLYARRLGDLRLVPFVWLGGSFVSSKIDPRNIDVVVAVDLNARDLIKGNPGAGWLHKAFMRESVLHHYDLSPLELPYRLVASPFRSHLLNGADQKYLRERGAWDDWLQRERDPDHPDAGPSTATAAARRGYVEVIVP